MFKKIILLLTISLIINACDDGDFEVPNFVFSSRVKHCGDLVLFNINADRSEALIIRLNENNENEAFFKTQMVDEVFTLNNQVAYRLFDDDVNQNYFCRDIPPISPTIREEWIGSAELIVNNTITFDDNDHVIELDLALNSDALFTPSDEIPDYYDLDDDNDGVKTSDELVPFGQSITDLIDADGDNTLDYLDTDGDQIFDYLDPDDDNDGTPTINESITNDSNDNGSKDYLDAENALSFPPRNQIENRYTLSYTTTFKLTNLSLNNSNGNTIKHETYNYGATTGSLIIQ